MLEVAALNGEASSQILTFVTVTFDFLRTTWGRNTRWLMGTRR